MISPPACLLFTQDPELVRRTRAFLRNRNEMAVSTESLSRRAPKKTARIGTIMLHNENNFLNRGDILHSALRMFNKR